MLKIETIHHVSLPVKDLERSKQFYGETLGLEEIERPPFDFPGAWYQLGERQLHLIVYDDSTLQEGKGVQSRDIHFAVRVNSYRETLMFLLEKGFAKGAANEFQELKVSPKPTAGFPQLYIVDPDRNIIELNAEQLDINEAELKTLGLA
jgi:glyoxylase I family protein